MNTLESTPLPELIAGWARIRPGRVAVRSAGNTLTYRELDQWAGQIAQRLAGMGITRGAMVAVLAEPSVAMIAAVAGITRLGAAYVPLDAAQPDERIARVLADAGVQAAVTSEAGAERLGSAGVPVLPITGTGPDPEAAAVERVQATPGDPAYVIYTSGSTGEPKGVLIDHRRLAASTAARAQVYPGEAVFLLVSPLAFDSSVAGIWGTLATGGELVVATSDEVRDPEALVRLIIGHQVGRMLCIPGVYQQLLAAARSAGTPLTSLETVIVAGEELPAKLLDEHFAAHPGVPLFNEYGPTEATVWATYRRFDEPGPVSIGGPVPGVRLYVLDDRLQPVQPGEQGELFIGGPGVAAGYLGRPEATATSFLPDPFTGRTAGQTAGQGEARMYRTGDLVRQNADGTLQFDGRRDHQVKIRGHRIELGSVETVLAGLPGVHRAVVLPEADKTQLIGFVLTEPDAGPAALDGSALRAAMAEKLPAVQVPAVVVVVPHFPVTVTGKVDRAKLREMAATATTQAHATVQAPATVAPAETGAAPAVGTQQVAAAWSEVLAVPDVPENVNFFDLGGHSLAMFKLQEALERHTGSRPSVVSLFRHTTVRAQTDLIRSGDATGARREGGARQAAALRARAARARRAQTRVQTS